MPAKLADLLFRLGLRRGITVNVPREMIIWEVTERGPFAVQYMISLAPDHEMTEWLDECEGPWAIRLDRPYYFRRTHVAFSRTADAVMFRFMTAK